MPTRDELLETKSLRCVVAVLHTRDNFLTLLNEKIAKRKICGETTSGGVSLTGDDRVALLDLRLPILVLGRPFSRQQTTFRGLLLELRLNMCGGGGGGCRGRRGYRETCRTRYVRRMRGRTTGWCRTGGRRQNRSGGATAGVILQLQTQFARLALLLGLLPSQRDLTETF